MSEQLQIFPSERPVWIDELWQRIGPDRRKDAVAILAQMARDALAEPVKMGIQEECNES